MSLIKPKNENKMFDFGFLNCISVSRCILTTVDPFLGEKSSDEEPLKTLKT